ncbi:hypothetical protein [Shewanella frigidimarina]|uniref:hypothetical protein n=1 Tax=Shewanella frigidimarina TaxID=56812 RepID=UPI003D7A174C
MEKIAYLYNKGTRAFWLVLALVFVYILISAMFDNTPSQVKDAKTSLFLGYRAHIYETAQCDIEETDEKWTIFCHPEDKNTGGLFEVDQDGSIQALNGTGQTHLARLEL